MPNHILNVLKIDDENYEEQVVIRRYVKSKDSNFDFKNIIPTPNHIFQGDLGPEEEEKYGDNTWYKWNTNNWGTKWNAYDIRVVSMGFVFQTAWTHPFPVIKALSEAFPHVLFRVAYADEGIPENMGFYTMRNGALENTWSPDEEKEVALTIGQALWALY